jgi:hypothetical protein
MPVNITTEAASKHIIITLSRPFQKIPPESTTNIGVSAFFSIYGLTMPLGEVGGGKGTHTHTKLSLGIR